MPRVSPLALASLASGVLVLMVGLIHVAHHELGSRFCSATASSCVGPYLAWNDRAAASTKDLNARFRDVFSVRPSVLGRAWAGVVLGAITIRAHHDEQSAILHNWPRLCAWHLATALFGCFAFAGGAGVVVGFVNVGVSAACLAAHVAASRGSGSHEVVGCDVLSAVPSPSCTVSAATTSRLVRVADALSLAATITLLVVGAFHVVNNEFHKWCREPLDCVGPLLVWPSHGDFFKGVNVLGWGSLFSCDPDHFLDVWSAVILAVITLLFPGESWWGIAAWQILLALIAFGIAGNVGIMAGFFITVAAAFNVLVAIASPPVTETGPRYFLLR